MNSRMLPLVAFLLLVALLVVGLKIADKKTQIPSPLIDKPVPVFDLPVLANPGQRMSNESLLGKPYLVNFWGSWCVTCRAEHPVVTELAKLDAVYILGMNFRDESEDAIAWLQKWGDPYDVSLLKCVVTYEWGWHLACENDYGDGIHIGSGNSGYRVGGPRTGGN